MLDAINVKMSIAGRMRILGLLMIVPVAFTSVLLFNSHMNTVKFARTEIAGNQYLAAVWPVIVAGASDQTLSDADAAGLTRAAAANTTLLKPETAEALKTLIGEDQLKAANAVAAKLTDSSSLILDPDLDSFYLMDGMAVRLPALMAQGRNLYDTRDEPDTEVQHQIYEIIFVNATADLKASFTKSGQYSHLKTLSPETQGALDRLSAASKAFSDTHTVANYQQFVAAANALFTPANRDLEHMLTARANKALATLTLQLALTGGVLLVALALTFIIASGLSRRLKVLSGLMQKLVKGEAVTAIPYQTDRHETGVIVETLLAFQGNLAETEQMRQTQHRLEEDGINNRRAAMLDMADRFESSVLNIVEGLSQSSHSLGQTAASLSTHAEQTRSRSHDVAHAMESASANVQSVAGATEEMAASSNAIADQAERAAMAADAAAFKAQETNEKVAAMTLAANSIGNSIAMISSITSQTNLLALNATIEAARAGDAGRGFSVVATEVKALAQQTAKVTEEIGQQVRNVQAATQQAGDAMIAIADMVMGLRDISNTISESVSQQTAAVGEISRSTAEVAMSTSDISGAVEEVSTTAHETGQQAQGALSEVQLLNDQTASLKATALDFLKTVRSA